MTDSSRELLKQMLELPPHERAEMAAELLDSLSGAEEAVEGAWAMEIEKRVAATRAGELQSTEWRQVLDRVEKEILSR